MEADSGLDMLLFMRCRVDAAEARIATGNLSSEQADVIAHAAQETDDAAACNTKQPNDPTARERVHSPTVEQRPS
jgi:hypothetical protein